MKTTPASRRHVAVASLVASLLGLSACGDSPLADSVRATSLDLEDTPVAAASLSDEGGSRSAAASSSGSPATAAATAGTVTASSPARQSSGTLSSTMQITVGGGNPAATVSNAAVSTSPSSSTGAQSTTSSTSGSGSTSSGSASTATATSTNTVTAAQPIPAASVSGYSTARVQQTQQSHPPTQDPNGVGAFRLTCNYSHMAFDDPIVFPGQPGRSHLHTFFGNTAVTGNTTTSTLVNSGDSTCAGGIANRSSYWVPSLIDTRVNRAIVPASMMVYYKSGYNSMPASGTQPMPAGLRVVAGNRATEAGPVSNAAHYFYCEDANGNHSTHQQSIPACAPGGAILSVLEFPFCWDGVNLDSVDHRSHMTYSTGGVNNVCPASHPVHVPVLTLNIRYEVRSGDSTAAWRLSSDTYAAGQPGGFSMHGDFWQAWQDDIKTVWMNNCVRTGMDCHGYLIGDGREVF